MVILESGEQFVIQIMITWRRCGFLIGVLFTVFRSSYSVAVSEVVCTDGGTQCNGIANSVCDTTTGVLKCKCDTGFDEDLTDRSTCVKVVSETGCSGNADCPANSACSSSKCACNTDYTEKVDTCVKAVSATSCSGSEACTGISNSACEDGNCACIDGFIEEIDTCTKVIGSACTGTSPCPGATNSVCTSNTCACKANYAEKENVCTLTVSGTTCSANGNECKGIENALCDTDAGKCTCSPSFTINVDTCVPENAAASVQVEAITMVLSVLATIVLLRYA